MVLAISMTLGSTAALAQDAAGPAGKIAPAQEPISAAQRARLAEKLQLVEQIVRGIEPDTRSGGMSAGNRRWMLQTLYSMSLEQVRSIAPQVTFAATSDEIVRAKSRPELKALGDAGRDLTYTPFAPCRYIDTRNVGGKISGARDFNLANNGSSYGGDAGCAPVTLSGVTNVSDVAAFALNLTIVDTSTAGSPGFATVRPVGSTNTTSLLNWTTSSAGFQLANAAAVSASQGSPNQIEIYTSGPVNAIVDLLGAFVRPGRTALDCSDGTTNSAVINANADGNVSSLSCQTLGSTYFPVSGECWTDNGLVNLVRSYFSTFLNQNPVWICGYHNFDSVTHNIYAYGICCRVPGK